MFSWASSRGPRRVFLALAALLTLAAVAAVLLLLLQAPGDISNPGVDFGESGAKKRPRSEGFTWPVYGLNPARTRYLDAKVKPPFRQVWQRRVDGSLLEFQPVLAGGTLYMVTNRARAVAIAARSGRIRWRRRVGTLSASSPAYSRGRLFVTTLSRRAVALDARRGKPRWSIDLPSRSESSPLALGGRVYFGSEDGTVYAVRARDGRKVWTYKARGAVKGGLAYAGGRLFFGDYSGEVTALEARNGRRAWSTATQGRSFSRAGRFYSTPAVAFGRVYLGNTDGSVYSFSTRSGQLAWSKSTGNYVYGAPAVARVPGTGPSVYIGSYDGYFYALDARSGAVRWRHEAGGRISGAGTIVGDVVYFSNLAEQSTTGVDTRSGKPVYKINHGAFNPVISDGRRLYLTGYATQYALEPKPKGQRKRSRRAPRPSAPR